MTSTNSTKFSIPDSGEQVLTTSTQYGMRFPDGTIKWVELEVGSGRNVRFKELHEENNGDYWWGEYTKRRAVAANLDPDTYAAQHKIVKRQVILALTPAEDA